MRKKISIIIFSALFLFSVSLTSGWADEHTAFQDGLEAYQKKDYTKALRLWRPLAKKGHAKTQYNLGILYFQGSGVPKDVHEAFKWFSKSAKQGYVNAQYHLGLMFFSGEGIKQNDKEAVKWFQKAAEQGDNLAQYSLAAMYVYGKGVPKDYVKAHLWSNLSARQGNKDAAKARDDIARNMTPSQIINARLLAREWEPKKKKSKKETRKEF